MNYQDIDTDKICRTCLSQVETMRSVFTIDENAGETARLNEMLMSYASVEVYK